MFEFDISLTSFQQVQQFVELAAKQHFDVHVGNTWQHINGKDFMGMFCLDYSRPVRVSVHCSQEEFNRFHADAAQFLV